jgi:predicted small secreted protein
VTEKVGTALGLNLSPWRKTKMKKIKGKMNLMRTGIVLCCLVAIFLSGCATGAGLGRDVQSLGQSIEKGAK